MTLSEIIIQRIEQDGAISFHDFMEMALYYTNLGYYTSGPCKIGPAGDFYTSSNLTSLFGEMIGKQIEEIWQHLGRNKFTIVEVGAGTGKLCYDILTYLKKNKQLYNCLDYCIVEKSPVMREKEKEYLSDKVRWYDSIIDIPEITGCVISNELVDNFAVHQVIMKDELKEVFVDYKKGFYEVLRPASNTLKNYFAELGVHLPVGYRTEVNIEAIEWIQEIATHLKRGFVITVDYGYPSSELYKDYRKDGTLVCYHRHLPNFCPYDNIGKQDITSHVNFSALYLWGLTYGLEYTGFTNQAHFLLSLCIQEQLICSMTVSNEDIYANYRKNIFIIQRLITEMGYKFKVLIQQKNMPHVELCGLKMASYSADIFIDICNNESIQ